MAERQFGPYRLVRQIAVGGMAEIHLAKTRGIAGFEKFVALKMIHPNFAQDEQFIQMLIDEAKIAVQLQHVNIAQTFDLGRVSETYYITMEYVDGADLYKILRRGSEQDLDMPLDVCAYVAKEMATGLDYAHRKRDVAGNALGIVHRDVSPQNVLITHAGEVKLVDFGIAKATMRVRQTQVGVIKGKYYYMSPEQAWGDPLDHRSDIFSCGIVLYEMITGQMLYLEEDLHRLLDMVRRADIAPPRTLRKDVPPQLERIVMHALAKNASDRYQNAADLATDLERFLHTYSPVFTASKLAAHLRKVVGDPMPIIEPVAAPAARSPMQQTQPLDQRELVHERSEISDENSVIFRMDELRARETARNKMDDESTAAELPRGTGQRRAGTGAQPVLPAVPSAPNKRAPTERPLSGQSGGQPRARTEPPLRARPPTQPPPQVPARVPPRPPTAQPVPPPRAPANKAPMVTTELADIEEMTSVSGPPGFDGGPTRSDGPGLDYGDYEPTMIDRAEEAEPPASHDSDSEDGPTITRDGKGVPLPPAVSLSPEPPPRPHAEIRSRVAARGAPAHPALAASTPTPAVSALRQPKSSRRTPPSGVPTQGNLLQQIVGASPSEPMPHATAPMRAPSDGVPRPMGDGAPSHAMTSPQGAIPPNAVAAPIPGPPGQIGQFAQMSTVVPGNIATQPAIIPGQYPLPVAYGPPPVPGMPPQQQQIQTQPQGPMPLHAPPTPLPGTVPSAQLPPHLVQYGGYGLPQAAQVIQPGYPYPYGGGQPMSFTKQMQAAIELDELPRPYRLQEQRSRKVIWIAMVIALVAGAVGVTAALMRGGTEAPASAILVIDSHPSGAKVTVDGTALDQLTPAQFQTTPGARHDVVVTAPHFKPKQQTITIPPTGGTVTVTAELDPATGKLHINSVPGGAEIWIGGELRGVTPKTLDGLDPATTSAVELRLKDFATQTLPLDWSKTDTIDLDVKFRR